MWFIYNSEGALAAAYGNRGREWGVARFGPNISLCIKEDGTDEGASIGHIFQRGRKQPHDKNVDGDAAFL